MTDPGTEPAYEARNCIRRSVAEMTGNLGDPLSPYSDPLKALGALIQLRVAVAGAEREAARKAREQGWSWGDIAGALGLDSPEAAFRRFAYDLGEGLVFGWNCPCGSLISDGGPEMPLDDAERGHAEGCERFAETLAAWDARWKDDEDG
jgi:hypothetical protein